MYDGAPLTHAASVLEPIRHDPLHAYTAAERNSVKFVYFARHQGLVSPLGYKGETKLMRVTNSSIQAGSH